jgi:hypothetical protein
VGTRNHLFGSTQVGIEKAHLQRFLPLLLARICAGNYLGHAKVGSR